MNKVQIRLSIIKMILRTDSEEKIKIIFQFISHFLQNENG